VERQNQVQGDIRQSLTDARERHEGSSVLCRGNLKVAFRVLETTGQEGASQNEEQVGKNGTEQLGKMEWSALRVAYTGMT